MITEKIKIMSQDLPLEGRMSYGEDLKKPCALVLMCPPHPFLGGDMDNNVLSELEHALSAEHYLTLTFNYRGIGESQTDKNLDAYQQEFWETATCPEYEDKIFIDSFAAFQLLRDSFAKQYPDCPYHGVGYSFGCLPVFELMMKYPRMTKGCFISPPLVKWGMKSEYHHLGQDKLFFYTPNDFACPEEDMLRAYEDFAAPKNLYKIDGAEHLYLGYEKQLAGLLVPALSGTCAVPPLGKQR